MTRNHANCADWGYDSHPSRHLVTSRCHNLTKKLLRNPNYFDSYGHDTRLAHNFMFRKLVPINCECVVGNYRGDKNCLTLTNCNVGVAADPRVGSPSYMVSQEIHALEQRCTALIDIHLKWKETKGINQSPVNKLLKFVSILADILQAFLTIHPYMDGNGHAGRLLIFVMMAREGYSPKNWDIDSKQPYSDALSKHRDGKSGALNEFLLKAIIGH